MAEKKSLYRFTIGFNPGDPAHRQVAELLNRQGRRKAQFLVNAILHYIHCSETPEIPETAEPPTGMGRAEMEALVVRILEERGYRKAGENQSDGQATQELPEPVLGGGLDAAGFAAIADTLAAFRGKE